MSDNLKRFYGKYRGSVSDNKDPLMLGRIRAKVAAILGDEETGWALPCTPYAGAGVGFFFIPPKDANVWIEFEAGNLDNPIWSGCFWGATEALTMLATLNPPATPITAPQMKVIKTDTATITLNDLPGAGGITIETTTGLKIIMDITGIKISNSPLRTLELTPKSVSINKGALEVI
jgi:hypothetical protein